MNLTFLNNTAFWGFLTLSIPLIIHLLNRSKGSTIWVGNVSWIQAAEKSKSKNIHLNEYALLLIRSAILSCLILILAVPVINSNKSLPEKDLTLIDSEIAKLPFIQSLIDTIKDNNHEIRYLTSKGIAELPEDSLSFSTNLFAALEQLQSLNRYQSVGYYSYGYMREVTGALPAFSYDFTWYRIPSNSSEVSIFKERFSNDSVLIVNQYLEDNNLLTKRSVRLLDQPDTSSYNSKYGLILVKEGDDQLAKDWIRVLESIEEERIHNFIFKGVYNLESYQPESSGSQIAVIIGKSEDFGLTGKFKKIISYNPQEPVYSDNKISIKNSGNHTYRVSGRISPEAVYDQEFLREVFAIIFEDEISPEKIRNSDYRQFTQNIGSGQIMAGTQSQILNFSLPFWIAFFLLLIIERVLSKHRDQ